MSTSSKRTYNRRELLKASILVLPTLWSARSLARVLGGSDICVRRSTFVMGSVATIEAYGPEERLLHQAITDAFGELHRLDAMMSVYNPESAVSAINRHAGKQQVAVPPEVLEVLLRAQQIHKLTGGSFDVTVEPLMKLWGFRNEGLTSLTRLPSDAEIATAVGAVGYQHLVLGQGTVGLTNPHSRVDFGGIAVGYALDRARRILLRAGVSSALINHSGDLIAIGTPPESTGWVCAIPDPANPREFIREFTLADAAASTSGSYEKFVEWNGTQYGHIMLPELGKPSAEMLGTTVIATDSLIADAFSTALFTMPLGRAVEVSDSVGQITRSYLIDSERSVHQIG